jgi:hypothetical protein
LYQTFRGSIYCIGKYPTFSLRIGEISANVIYGKSMIRGGRENMGKNKKLRQGKEKEKCKVKGKIIAK